VAQNAVAERAVLAVADSEVQHLAPPVRAHSGRDHHGLGDHPTTRRFTLALQ
jgi:hypothetical protein